MAFIIAYTPPPQTRKKQNKTTGACSDRTSWREGVERHKYRTVVFSEPLSRDGISDISSHMIREDFYYTIITQPPPSVT